METLLAGLFLDRCRRGLPHADLQARPVGARRFVVALGIVAISFAALDRVATTTPVTGLSMAASGRSQQGESQCNMSAWSMARKAASMR